METLTPQSGDDFARARTRAGFPSQDAIAQALDVSRSTIARIEASPDPPPRLYSLALQSLNLPTVRHYIRTALNLLPDDR